MGEGRPQFPGVPGNGPSSAAGSDESSTLREMPQGLKRVLTPAQCSLRLEHESYLEPPVRGHMTQDVQVKPQHLTPWERRVYSSSVPMARTQQREETGPMGGAGDPLCTVGPLCTKRFLCDPGTTYTTYKAGVVGPISQMRKLRLGRHGSRGAGLAHVECHQCPFSYSTQLCSNCRSGGSWPLPWRPGPSHG